MTKFTEDTVELAAIEGLQQMGCNCIRGRVIALGEPTVDLMSYSDAVLSRMVSEALRVGDVEDIS